MSIFIDVRKAFDTVDFKALIKRLESKSIRGNCLEWFKSYLTGRSLRVAINNVMSSAFSVRCGGLLLCLVYVDSMRFYLKEACTISSVDYPAYNLFGKSIDKGG